MATPNNTLPPTQLHPNRPKYLIEDIDPQYDHIIGQADAKITMVEYGIIMGLVVGKPLGIFGGAWLASVLKIADKPDTYSWRQLLGAAAISGIGFTMSIFIASLAFKIEDFPAAKIAIFIASFAAAALGTIILWRQKSNGNTAVTSP